MRRLQMALAALAAAGLWAGGANAAPLDLTNSATRTILIQPNLIPCTNPDTAGVGGSTLASASCFVYANNSAAVFSSSSEFTGTLSNLGGTLWQIDVDSATWQAVVEAQQGVAVADSTQKAGSSNGLLPGTISDLIIQFDSSLANSSNPSSTSTVDPTNGSLTYFSAKLVNNASIALGGNGVLNLFGDDAASINPSGTPRDRPYFGTPVANSAGLVFSCNGSGTGGPTTASCPPGIKATQKSLYPLQPGFVSGGPNGTTLTGFQEVDALAIIPQVWSPLDYLLTEIPEPGTVLLLAGGLVGLGILGRRRAL